MNASDSCRDHNDIYAQYSVPIQNIHRLTAMTTRHRIPKNLPFFIRVLEFTSCDEDICMQTLQQNSGLVAEDMTRKEGDSPAPNTKLTQTAIWTTKQLMTN